MESYRKEEQKQYKNDLEYLISLKKYNHGDMTQEEWEAFNRKLHYMNDRYAYGELDKINFLRGMMKSYENEAYLKKENMRKKKELENEEDRKKLLNVSALEIMEKEKEKEKKQKLLSSQIDDLNNFNRRKLLNNKLKMAEDQKFIQNFNNESNKWGSYNQMQNKLKNKNEKIYGNCSKYNDLIGDPYDPNAFNAKNDLEFNKIIAEQKERQRKKNRSDPDLTNGIIKASQEIENENRMQRENNINRQKLYKEYLDNQNQMDKLNKLKNKNDDTRPQLLMPAYYYPNLPEPIYHKARDSLLASKNQENYFGKNMNKFFTRDISRNTLLDYEENRGYLGDSRLRHNPITCPVNDYYYNKYINSIKKNSEYIPPNNNENNNRLQMDPRSKLIKSGQYIMH